jgi:hypothetical protein
VLLYAIERSLRGRTAEDRHAGRQATAQQASALISLCSSEDHHDIFVFCNALGNQSSRI